jgi:tRNA pseudouridine65 synthase
VRQGLEILYRDDRLVAVNKPSGLAVHRGWSQDGEVVMMLLRDALSTWVHPVHRLDRATSGVLLFGLDAEVAARTQALFVACEIKKRYLALVRGVPEEETAIDHAIPRSEDGPRVPARTVVRRLFATDRHAWVEARPETGRLHQVRRHLKHISHPIIGDVRYGKGEHNRLFRSAHGLHRLALHALELRLPHPFTGEEIIISARVPDDLAAPLRSWGLPESFLSL